MASLIIKSDPPANAFNSSTSANKEKSQKEVDKQFDKYISDIVEKRFDIEKK